MVRGDDGGKVRYQEFLEMTHDRQGKGRPWTADARQTAAYWEEETRNFPAPTFWDDNRAYNLAQAVEAKQIENKAADPELMAVKQAHSGTPEQSQPALDRAMPLTH